MSDQKQPNITIDRGAALKDVDISTHNNNNTVIYQGGAAEEKRKEDNRAFFREFACKLLVKDIITDDIRQILDAKAFELNLTDSERDHIIEQVRVFASKNVQMSELHKISLNEAKENIQKNTNIESAVISLKALADKFSHEEVDFYYNMAMAAHKPGDHINQYINRKSDSYWQTYWVYLSYVKMKRYEDAENVILKLGDYGNYPVANVIPVLKNAGLLIRTSDYKHLKSKTKDVESSPISPLLTMFKSTLDYVADNGLTLTNSPYANFYLENFFNLKNAAAKPVITPKDQGMKKSDLGYDKTGSDSGSKANNGSTGVVTVVDEGKNKKLADDVIKVVSQNGGKGGNSNGGVSAGSGRILKSILIGAACLIAGSFIVNKLKPSEEKAPAVQTVVEKPASVKSNSVKPNVENTNSVKPKAENTTAVKTEVHKVSEEKPVIQTPPPAKPSEMTVDEAYRMGKNLLAGGDYSKAALYLSSASDRGSIAAIYEMALLYKNGSGVSKDSATAFDYMLKAAESGYTKAFREVGEMYHGGRGTVKDRTQAEYWYRKAAAAGDAKAERLLNNM